jgi:hypothetical protein
MLELDMSGQTYGAKCLLTKAWELYADEICCEQQRNSADMPRLHFYSFLFGSHVPEDAGPEYGSGHQDTND